MKVRVNEDLIYLRGETEEERRVLHEMWKHGVVPCGGGTELTICSRLFFGSESRRAKYKRLSTRALEKLK